APDLFRLRTTAKRQHTNLVTRVYNMINRRAAQAGFVVLSTDLEAALERVTAINERYVIAGELDDQERAAAEDYIQGVAAVNRQARLAIGGYLQPGTNPRLEGWIVEDSNIDQALQQ
ncbi:Uncharacterized protein APZ42_009032, partial [Daphnia magna]